MQPKIHISNPTPKQHCFAQLSMNNLLHRPQNLNDTHAQRIPT